MKIKLAYSLLVCSLFLVASCGAKGPLYHEKTDSAAKVEKTETTGAEIPAKSEEEKK